MAVHLRGGSEPGVDVMVAIFCDFWQFSAKKIGVFLKNQCYDQLFSKFSFVLSQKHQFFRRIFRQKYFKNHNIGPGFFEKMAQNVAQSQTWNVEKVAKKFGLLA
jgi:hypothetical protein